MFGLHADAGISFWDYWHVGLCAASSVKPLFFVQHGVCGRVVVHFHLPIYLHVYASLLDIGQQLVDSSGEVNLLFEQDI